MSCIIMNDKYHSPTECLRVPDSGPKCFVWTSPWVLTIRKEVHLFIEKISCWIWDITNLGREGNRDAVIDPNERMEAGSGSR